MRKTGLILIVLLSACDAIFPFHSGDGSPPQDQRIDLARQDAVADLLDDDAKPDGAMDVGESDAGKPDPDSQPPADLGSNDGATDAKAGPCTSSLLFLAVAFTYWTVDGPTPPSTGALAIEWEAGYSGSAILTAPFLLLDVNDSCLLSVSVITELSGQDTKALTVDLYDEPCGWDTCRPEALLFECTIDVLSGVTTPTTCNKKPHRSGTAQTIRLTATVKNELRVKDVRIEEMPP